MKKSPRGERRGASILLLSLVFMVILLLLSVTLFKIIPSELHAARASHEGLNGHYVARAGVQDAMAWLKWQMDTFDTTQAEADLPDYNTAPLGSTPVYPNVIAYEAAAAAKRPFAEGDWRYEVQIRPQQDTKTLVNNLSIRYFAVRATSFHRNKPIRQIDVLLEQSSFALYAFLSKDWDPNSTMIVTGENAFQGPVHTDDYWNFDVSALEATSWSDPNTVAFFSDLVSHASTDPNGIGGDGNVYTGGAPYDANGPIAGRYEQIFQGGRDDLRLKSTVELPSSTEGAFSQTWINTDPNSFPTIPGGYISTDVNGATGLNGQPLIDGGLLVEGDMEELNLRLDRYGNQKIVMGHREKNGTTTSTRTKWKYIPYSPPQYYDCSYNKCNAWGPPPGGGGGGAGGAGLPDVCIGWVYVPRTCERTQRVPNGTYTNTSTNYDPYETVVYEVTENNIYMTDDLTAGGTPLVDANSNPVLDVNGNPPLAQIGQTLLINRHRDDSNGWEVENYQVYDGQINGNIYVNGNVGGRLDRYGEDYRNGQPESGLWGIAKGSAATDVNGAIVPGEYNNKAIITPLDKYIKVGGDMLQFDETRFNNNPGINFESKSGGDSQVRNWAEYAALNPNAVGGAELSPNNNHVLGVITRDVWMAPPKRTNSSRRRELNGNDGKADLYGVFLAGSTFPSDPNDPNSPTITDGGFGTWYRFRDRAWDRMGEVNVYGGVIQGTSGKNSTQSNNNYDHAWVDAGGLVGYNVSMTYDLNATKQRLFPLLSEFGIVRIFEKSVRSL